MFDHVLYSILWFLIIDEDVKEPEDETDNEEKGDEELKDTDDEEDEGKEDEGDDVE